MYAALGTAATFWLPNKAFGSVVNSSLGLDLLDGGTEDAAALLLEDLNVEALDCSVSILCNEKNLQSVVFLRVSRAWRVLAHLVLAHFSATPEASKAFFTAVVPAARGSWIFRGVRVISR